MKARDAVLVIAFNRPTQFAQLIERIREVRPDRIYIAVDGPRRESDTDKAAVTATRELVASIDWTTNVHCLFRESNLGCGRGVTEAINWFFSHEDRGIILEDDILPRVSFFEFCSELLDRYSTDPKVLAISGCNFVPSRFISTRGAYRFSVVPNVWGWATWKNKWVTHKIKLSEMNPTLTSRRLWHSVGRSLTSYLYWRAVFSLVRAGRIDTWDYQLVYAAFANEMLTATSNVNLVDNRGFGDGASHTSTMPEYLKQSEEITFPTGAVPFEVDVLSDRWIMKSVYGATATGLIKKVRKRVFRRS